MEMTMAGAEAREREIGLLMSLTGILIRPRAMLLALSCARHSWWGVAALLMVMVIVLSVVAYSHADCQYVYRLEMEQYRSSASQLTRPPVAPTPLPITMAIRFGGRLVSTLGSWVLWAGALYLVTVLSGESGVGFGGMWKLVLWASIPYAIRSVAQSAYMLAIKTPIYNQALSGLVIDRTPPPLMTFHYAIPTKQQLALASVFERLDIYLLWHLALIIVGLMVVAKLSRKKAVAITLGLWLVFALIGTVPHFFPRTFARFTYF
jgi:hypothetical protein